MHRLVDIAAGQRSRSLERLADLDDSDTGDSAAEGDDSPDGARLPTQKRRLEIFESEEQDLLPSVDHLIEKAGDYQEGETKLEICIPYLHLLYMRVQPSSATSAFSVLLGGAQLLF